MNEWYGNYAIIIYLCNGLLAQSAPIFNSHISYTYPDWSLRSGTFTCGQYSKEFAPVDLLVRGYKLI